MHTCVHTYIHAYINTHILACTHAHVHGCIPEDMTGMTETDAGVRAHTYTHTHIHTYTHTHTHTHTLTHTHTHAHTHAWMRVAWCGVVWAHAHKHMGRQVLDKASGELVVQAGGICARHHHASSPHASSHHASSPHASSCDPLVLQVLVCMSIYMYLCR
jgi:hypothetical protein